MKAKLVGIDLAKSVFQVCVIAPGGGVLFNKKLGRAKFIDRFGSLDVYHFDVYSVALSKIERGRDADFADVLALLEAGWLNF